MPNFKMANLWLINLPFVVYLMVLFLKLQSGNWFLFLFICWMKKKIREAFYIILFNVLQYLSGVLIFDNHYHKLCGQGVTEKTFFHI